MTIKAIESESDYEKALVAVEALMDLDPDTGTPEAKKLESLVAVIQEYEGKKIDQMVDDP